jgi:hypothetical protein
LSEDHDSTESRLFVAAETVTNDHELKPPTATESRLIVLLEMLMMVLLLVMVVMKVAVDG